MQKKRCKNPKCNKLLPLSEFHKNKNKADGHVDKCKLCVCAEKIEFYKTNDGLLTRIYSHQRASSRQRGDTMPTYSNDEFKEIAYANGYQYIFDIWEKSSWDRWLTPSCDRICDYSPYSENNIMFTTWGENFTKYQTDRMDGVNNKQNKAVLQFDMDGNFIAEYYSIAEAARVVSADVGNIIKVCNGVKRSICGFVWKYK